VLDELDALIVGKALACRVEHDLGEVKADANDLWTSAWSSVSWGFWGNEMAYLSVHTCEDYAGVVRESWWR
jgi:hypothetical protein